MALRLSGRRSVTMTAAALGLTLVMTACGGDDGDDTAAGGDAGGENGGGDCADYEQYTEDFGDLEGTEVTLYTSILPPEQQGYETAWTTFEECTGIDIVYEGSAEFEAQLPVRIEGGNAPDIALIPQPGLLQTLVRETDSVVPAPEQTEANVDEYYGEDWKGYGSVDGTFYAAPNSANIKSFVWYSPSAFEEGGYEIPETWDEMLALSDQIIADNPDIKPWCAGIGSGEATGWPATDWLEDVMLRTAGPEVYDQWIAHEIPFNDPQVAEALDIVGNILKNDDYVNGGLGDVTTIASTTFQEGGAPILDGACYLHRQASFYAAQWNEFGAEIGPEADVFAFYLPPIDEAQGSPVLGGGEFVTAFADRPEVQAAQTFLSSPEFVNLRAQEGSFLSANTGLEVDNVPDPLGQLSVEILQDPEAVFRFDASDLMPGEVGAGSFWTGMTDWITGADTQQVLDQIENTWPE